MKENNVERWMVDQAGDVIDVRSGQMVACLVDVSVPTRRGYLIAAAPDMCALLGNLAAACDGWDDDWENDEQRADAFWHMARAAKVLLAEIEGGENNG